MVSHKVLPGMKRFSPHLEIFPAPEQALWNELSEVSREFVLYGGTARLCAPAIAEDNGLGIASLLDLAGTKVNLPLALSFFDDGDLRILSEEMKSRLPTAAREVDLDRWPHIESFSHQIDHDSGYEL
jgi:hypothetical protein